MVKIIAAPLTPESIKDLRAGDIVLLSGKILVARDAAHKKLVDAIRAGESIPFSLKDEVIFYAGPAPTPANAVIGPIGPTTSGRMDAYTPTLLELGLRGMIGKGRRSDVVLMSIKKNKAVYFGATGGTAALLSSCIVSVEKVAYEDLGPEAVLRLEVKDMPLVVLADSHGGDQYLSGPFEAQKYC